MAHYPTPTEVFDSAFEVLMEFEGYMSDDAHDAGGLTKFGISQKSYPHLDIAALTMSDAKNIYEADYFRKSHAHSLPPHLACIVFDTAVNMGTGRAIRFLQRTIGTTADGIFGSGSRRKLDSALTHKGEENIVLDLLSYRAVFYAKLSARKTTQSKYLRGWLRRTYRLQQYINSKSW
jgi:lysozyme family protein